MLKYFKKRSKNAHMSLWTMEETRTEWKDPQFKAHTFFDLKGIYVCPKLWYNFSQNSGRGKKNSSKFYKIYFSPNHFLSQNNIKEAVDFIPISSIYKKFWVLVLPLIFLATIHVMLLWPFQRCAGIIKETASWFPAEMQI